MIQEKDIPKGTERLMQCINACYSVITLSGHGFEANYDMNKDVWTVTNLSQLDQAPEVVNKDFKIFNYTEAVIRYCQVHDIKLWERPQPQRNEQKD